MILVEKKDVFASTTQLSDSEIASERRLRTATLVFTTLNIAAAALLCIKILWTTWQEYKRRFRDTSGDIEKTVSEGKSDDNSYTSRSGTWYPWPWNWLPPADVYPLLFGASTFAQGIMFVIVEGRGLAGEPVTTGCQHLSQVAWAALWINPFLTLCFSFETAARAIASRKFSHRSFRKTVVCLAVTYCFIFFAWIPSRVKADNIPDDYCPGSLLSYTNHLGSVGTGIFAALLPLTFFLSMVILMGLSAGYQIGVEERISATTEFYFFAGNSLLWVLIIPSLGSAASSGTNNQGITFMAAFGLNVSGIFSCALYIWLRTKRVMIGTSRRPSTRETVRSRATTQRSTRSTQVLKLHAFATPPLTPVEDFRRTKTISKSHSITTYCSTAPTSYTACTDLFPSTHDNSSMSQKPSHDSIVISIARVATDLTAHKPLPSPPLLSPSASSFHERVSRNTIGSFQKVGEEISTFISNLQFTNSTSLLSPTVTNATRPNSWTTESLLAPSSASLFSTSDFPEPPPLPPAYAKEINSYFSPASSPEPSPTLGNFPLPQTVKPDFSYTDHLSVPPPARKPSRASRSKLPSIDVLHAKTRSVEQRSRDLSLVVVRSGDNSPRTPEVYTPTANEEARKSLVASILVGRNGSKNSLTSQKTYQIPPVPPEPIDTVVATGDRRPGRKSEDAESFKEIRRPWS